MEKEKITEIVKEHYKGVANNKCKCKCQNKSNEEISESIGYSKKEIEEFSEANMGLGCGNPTAIGEIKENDVVIDLGSGAGFDCFIAAKKTKNKVIGIDMVDEMLEKARKIAEKHNYSNVEFKKGMIEEIPLQNQSVNVVMSNCVINLSPNKDKVFKEAYRILKENGRMYVSDIVLLQELTEEQKNDKELIGGCVAGAIMKEEYLKLIEEAGFKIEYLDEDKEISKRQYEGIALESLKLRLRK
jgi:arsenite methyltransferase